MITRCLLQRTDAILAKQYVDCGRDRIVAFDPELFDLATRTGMRCELLTERPPYSEFAYAVAAAKARASSIDHQIASTIAKVTGLFNEAMRILKPTARDICGTTSL